MYEKPILPPECRIFIVTIVSNIVYDCTVTQRRTYVRRVLIQIAVSYSLVCPWFRIRSSVAFVIIVYSPCVSCCIFKSDYFAFTLVSCSFL